MRALMNTTQQLTNGLSSFMGSGLRLLNRNHNKLLVGIFLMFVAKVMADQFTTYFLVDPDSDTTSLVCIDDPQGGQLGFRVHDFSGTDIWEQNLAHYNQQLACGFEPGSSVTNVQIIDCLTKGLGQVGIFPDGTAVNLAQAVDFVKECVPKMNA